MLEGGLAFATSRGLIAPEVAGPLAKALVLLLAGYGLWANRHLRGLWFVVLGLACNTAVIVANGGHMPVSPEALRQIGLESAIADLERKYDAVHSLMTSSTPLWFLGDILPVQLWGYRNVISLGDVYLMAGVFATVVEAGLLGRRQSRAEAVLDIDWKF